MIKPVSFPPHNSEIVKQKTSDFQWLILEPLYYAYDRLEELEEEESCDAVSGVIWHLLKKWGITNA